MKKTLVVIEVSLVIAFVCGYAARYIHPRHAWWLQLIAPFIPGLAVIVVGSAAAAALTHQWKRLGVYGILCLLAGIRFLPAYGQREGAYGQPEGESFSGFTVMTFNDQFVNYVPPDKRRGEVQKFIADVRPDVVCLQEAEVAVRDGVALGGNSSIALFLIIDGYTIAAYDKAPSERYWVSRPIIGRAEMGTATNMGINRDTGKEGGAPPSDSSFATRTSFVWKGREVAVYNLHLRSFKEKMWAGGGLQQRVRRLLTYKEDYIQRAREAEFVRQALEGERRPFVVCGDLNSTPHNWAYAHLSGGLHDAFGAKGHGWGGTYPQQSPIFRIDYVFFSPEWTVSSASVGDLPYSDHLPVIARGFLHE